MASANGTQDDLDDNTNTHDYFDRLLNGEPLENPPRTDPTIDPSPVGSTSHDAESHDLFETDDPESQDLFADDVESQDLVKAYCTRGQGHVEERENNGQVPGQLVVLVQLSPGQDARWKLANYRRDIRSFFPRRYQHDSPFEMSFNDRTRPYVVRAGTTEKPNIIMPDTFVFCRVSNCEHIS